MTIARIYQAIALSPNMQLQLDVKASHHLVHVLRTKIGDEINLFNGEGGEYRGVILHINKKGVLVEVKQFIDRDTESPIEIILAQGIARNEKMDFIMQKSVELGVNKIIPLVTERSNVKLTHVREGKRLNHWQSIIVSACEQCGRNRLPILEEPLLFKEWINDEIKTDYRFMLSPYHSNEINFKSLSSPRSLLLLIGPEGGFSENEINSTIEQKFLALNLGPRILRTETASLAALAILQAQFGDM